MTLSTKQHESPAQVLAHARDALQDIEQRQRELPAELARAARAADAAALTALRSEAAAVDDQRAAARITLARADLARLDEEIGQAQARAHEAGQRLGTVIEEHAAVEALWIAAQRALAPRQGIAAGQQQAVSGLGSERRAAVAQVQHLISVAAQQQGR